MDGWQVFILGMLLAKLRQLLDKKATASQHGHEASNKSFREGFRESSRAVLECFFFFFKGF